VNPEFTRITGYTLEDIPSGREWFRKAYPDPDYRKTALDTWKQDGFSYTGSAVDREFTIMRKDGKTVVASIRTTFLKDFSIMALYDVTARKRGEEALRQSEKKFRDIAELMPQMIYEIDRDGRLTFANKEALKTIGITEDEYKNRFNVFDLFPPDERSKIRQNMERVVREGSSHGNEYTILKKDGTTAPVLIYSVPVLRDREHTGFRGIIIDIAERKRAEESLREGDAKYKTLFESANDSIFLLKNDVLVDCNSKTLTMFGCTRDQIIGQPAFCFSPPFQPDGRDSREKAREKIGDAFYTGSQFYEWRHCGLDGTVFDTEVSLSTVTIGGEVLLQAIVRDITERKNLEAQLLQAQKMEAVGTLAGGVAHDFNNILTAMMGYAGLIGTRIQEDHELSNYLKQIQACTSRAANLTRGLLAFSRKQAVELKPHSTNTILRDCEKLLRRLVPEDVNFTLSLNEDVTIMVDVTQIDQVLINLVSNAKDAMPKGGILNIETKGISLGREFKQAHGFGAPGRYALISLSDTGSGIDEATQKKIFEPFFTTKEMGKGTGLGLSIVYGIIKQHGGYITVSSEPGKRTTFDIYLPAVKAKVSEADEAPTDAPGGTETLLLAEDDVYVRDMAREILCTYGYTIVEAKDGEDAVRKYTELSDSIDLILLDVVMPGKNGKEAYDDIRKIKPSIPVIFMSGYTGDIVLQKGVEDTKVNYVSKPVLPYDLLKKIREALDR
jgi:two-component system, cell cycle sensor histidine kinase and response regulator CckA